MREFFRRFARRSAIALGSPWAFLPAAVCILAWAVSGFYLGFSERWQVYSNVGATLVTFVTFLMVFVVQNAQNRDAKALQIKLDELLCSVEGARTSLLNLENLTDEELEHLHHELQRLHGQADDEAGERAEGIVPWDREGRERDGAAA